MRYIDKYPGCEGCPHKSYCGKTLSPLHLCNSYEMDKELSDDEKLPSVMGQLIYRACISYSLWKCILTFAERETDDGYTGLAEYLDQSINCQCEQIPGTQWCEIELGADSYREEEWCALHRIVSCIRWHYENVSSNDVQYQSCEGLQLSSSYMMCKPFTPSKEQEEYIMANLENLTPEQATSNLSKLVPLKNE